MPPDDYDPSLHPSTPPPAHTYKQLLNEAYEERDSLRQRVGASEDADGTIVVGFSGSEQQAPQAQAQQGQEAAAPKPVEEKREKELVGSGAASSVNDFED